MAFDDAPSGVEITRLEAYDAYNICYLAIWCSRSGEVVRCGMIANSGKATLKGFLAPWCLRGPGI